MKITLVADSSANKHNEQDMTVAYAPLSIVTDKKEYPDNDNLDVMEMLNDLKAYKGKSSTSCPSVADWIDAFQDGDEVLGVAITSGLSGSYNSSQVAAEQYKESKPGAKVFIMDSLSTGPEMQLILEKYKELVDKGLHFEDIVNKVKEYHKQTHLLFSLESLDNLVKNGRVNPIVGKVAGVLGIRMVGRASDQGTLEPLYKARGEKKAIQCIVKAMAEAGFKGGKCRISHTFNKNMGEQIAALIKEKWGNCDLTITENTGLCSYYAERGGVLVGFEG